MNQMKACVGAITIIASVLAFMIWTPTLASAKDDDVFMLEEITVTAEKRSADIQEVPSAVSAVTGDQLTRSGIVTFDDIDKLMPDVEFSGQGAGGGKLVSIRGVMTTSLSSLFEVANSILIDGNYLGNYVGIDTFLYDVERIEVNKGPQGTLYGRNANGGTINIITRKPELGKVSAEGELEYGSYNLLRTQTVLNVPFGETIAMRAAVRTYNRDGYMKSGLNDGGDHDGRLSFLWEPNQKQSLLLTADAQIINQKGSSTVSNAVATTSNTSYVPSDAWDDRFYQTPFDPVTGVRGEPGSANNNQTQNKGVSLKYDLDFGVATWTTQADLRQYDSDTTVGHLFGTGPIDPVSGYPGSVRFRINEHTDHEQVETRLVSNEKGMLEWLVGLYGFHSETGNLLTAFPDLYTVNPVFSDSNGDNTARSFAGFAQVVYTPLEKLHFTVGGRYSTDHKEVENSYEILPFVGLVPIIDHREVDWDNFTYKIGVSYDLTDTSILYANVSTGFKAGGYGNGLGIDMSKGPVYEPEKITSYEIGSKNRFLGDRLQLNLEGWYYKYKDFQTTISMYPVGQPFGLNTVATAGNAHYFGGSMDVQFLITEADYLRVMYSRLYAKYDKFVVPAPPGYEAYPGAPPGTPLQDLTDSDILRVPDSTGSMSYDHKWYLPSCSFDWQVDASYRGKVLFYKNAGVEFTDDAYLRWDTSLKYEPKNTSWSITGYVRNIGDSVDYNYGDYFPASGVFAASLCSPRTFGVILSVKLR